jgi:uncharacterized protein
MTDALHLSTLPLFPLSTVLYPGGILSLQIFELRYLDMVGKAHQTGAPFGVVLLTQGAEVRKPADTEVFERVGTLATITQLARPQAGLMSLQCLGTQRFAITRREQLRNGLWVGDVICQIADIAVEIPPDLQAAADALGQLIANLQQRNATALPVHAPYQLDDCGWVANRWCEMLPMPPELKQRLMALDNPLVRLELVNDVLRKTGIVAK